MKTYTIIGASNGMSKSRKRDFPDLGKPLFFDAEPKPAGELPAKQALIAEPISSTPDNSIAGSREKGNVFKGHFLPF